MVVLRILAWILVALALMVLGHDAISTLEDGVPVITTSAEMLNLLGIGITVPEGGIGKIFLELPLDIVLGVPGIILTLLFRPID